MDGSRGNSCVRCDQVDDLVGLVAEVRKEADRQRSIRESEQEIDWWSHALTSLKPGQGQPPENARDQRDPISSRHQDVGRVLKGSGEWKQVHNRGSKQTLSLPTTPPQMPLHNRCEALAVESVDDAGVDPSTPQELPRPEGPTPPYYYHLHKE